MMRIKFIVGLLLLLIVLAMVRICNAETETQMLNRAKTAFGADYRGKTNIDANDGDVCLKSTTFYKKDNLPDGNKKLTPIKFNYIVVNADGKAFRRSK